ncbi:hypothetical protein HanIR_Chr13g0627971 [Helianthus annuus]|nr:hypothetical protein HanIR_Chr13g0627971 [Helianthus annuus]
MVRSNAESKIKPTRTKRKISLTSSVPLLRSHTVSRTVWYDLREPCTQSIGLSGTRFSIGAT